LKHLIGDGSSVFPWHGHWHPFGPLLVHFPARIVYDSALSFQAKARDLNQESVWHWPTATRSDD